jgi:tRNA (guanine37-N1)-methyltransferase
MKIVFLTIFPEIIESYLSSSIIGKAIKKGLIEYKVLNIRDFSKDKHKKVDDYILGGGKGMLFTPQPLYDAVIYSKSLLPNSKVIYMSPRGRVLNNELLKNFSRNDEFVIICGRYEGIDQRIIDLVVDEEISIGDFVLTGGELPALVFFDSLVRMKGLLHDEAVENESFSYLGGLLEYDQYTRPREFMGLKVSEVLVSGNHKEIEKWRRMSALKNTYISRPELLLKVKLSRDDIIFLSKLARELHGLKGF